MIWPWDHEAILGSYKLLFIIKWRLILVINNFISGHFKWHFNFVPVFNQEILRQCEISDLCLKLLRDPGAVNVFSKFKVP